MSQPTLRGLLEEVLSLTLTQRAFILRLTTLPCLDPESAEWAGRLPGVDAEIADIQRQIDSLSTSISLR